MHSFFNVATVPRRATPTSRPSEADTRAGVTFLTEQAALATQSAASAPADPKKTPVPPARVALAQLCQALMISNEFLYVD